MHALTDSLIAYLSGQGAITAYAIIFLILFAETGLLVGFFLPGDSLLIALGVIAPRTHLSLLALVIAAALGAIIGNTTGYTIGRLAGPKLLQSKFATLLKPYIDESHAYFEKYGRSTLIITRFTPVIRTFIPTVAGVSRMDRGVFTLFNVVGGILWSSSIILGGYWLAKHVPAITTHITLIEIVILVASLAVAARHILTITKAHKENHA